MSQGELGELGAVRGRQRTELGAAEQVAVVEIDPSRRDQLSQRFPGVTVSHEPAVCRGLIVATKPAETESKSR